jgi:predicted metal-dependent hydrolase
LTVFQCEGVTEEKRKRQNEGVWQNFVDVSSDAFAVINACGKAAHSLGQKRYMFNEAERRLTAFPREVAKGLRGQRSD